MKTKSILLSIFLAFILVVDASSTTYYVRSSGGSDSNDGLSELTAFATINKAFTLSTLLSNDIIDISGTFTLINQAPIKSVTIQGHDNTTAIINGVAGSANRCFTVTSGLSVVFENVTFQNYDNYLSGTNSSGSVFIVNNGGTLTCRNVKFLNNRSTTGGAINIGGGTVTFEDCYFYNNYAKLSASSSYGGAINVSAGGTTFNVTVNRCLFENNVSELIGSAIRFRGNVADTNPKLTITNSTFKGNASNDPNATNTASGAIYLEGTSTTADVKIINNTFAYNTAAATTSGRCAGVTVYGISNCVTLINNILYSNYNSYSTPQAVSVVCSSGKVLKESRNNITDSNFNFDTYTTSGSSSGNITGVTGTNLKLSNTLSNNGGSTETLAIADESIAINAGYNTNVPAVDQRNISRIGVTDIGAYEYIGPTTSTKLTLENTAFSVVGNRITINLVGLIQVFNIDGVLIFEKNVLNDHSITLEHGLYIVKFTSGNERKVNKIKI